MEKLKKLLEALESISTEEKRKYEENLANEFISTQFESLRYTIYQIKHIIKDEFDLNRSIDELNIITSSQDYKKYMRAKRDFSDIESKMSKVSRVEKELFKPFYEAKLLRYNTLNDNLKNLLDEKHILESDIKIIQQKYPNGIEKAVDDLIVNIRNIIYHAYKKICPRDSRELCKEKEHVDRKVFWKKNMDLADKCYFLRKTYSERFFDKIDEGHMTAMNNAEDARIRCEKRIESYDREEMRRQKEREEREEMRRQKEREEREEMRRQKEREETRIQEETRRQKEIDSQKKIDRDRFGNQRPSIESSSGFESRYKRPKELSKRKSSREPFGRESELRSFVSKNRSR